MQQSAKTANKYACDIDEARNIVDIYEVKLKLNEVNVNCAIEHIFNTFTRDIGPICFIRVIEPFRTSRLISAYVRFWRHIHNNICVDMFSDDSYVHSIQVAEPKQLVIRHNYPYTKVHIMDSNLHTIEERTMFPRHAKYYIAEKFKVGQQLIKTTDFMNHQPYHETNTLQPDDGSTSNLKPRVRFNLPNEDQCEHTAKSSVICDEQNSANLAEQNNNNSVHSSASFEELKDLFTNKSSSVMPPAKQAESNPKPNELQAEVDNNVPDEDNLIDLDCDTWISKIVSNLQ
jgi:hypothetical protein